MRVLRSLVVVLPAVLVLAVPAHAHVSVDPASAPSGQDARLTFRVPNERSATATVRLQLRLPVDFERVEPGEVAGWEHRVEGDVVTWEGGRIEPGSRLELPLLVGPLPSGEPLVFGAVQTYEDGEVVRWIDEAGGDHPAPVLQVTGEGRPAPTTTTLHEEAVPAPTETSPDRVTTSTPEVALDRVEGDDDGPPAALVVAGGLVLLALVVGAVSVVRRRRTP